MQKFNRVYSLSVEVDNGVNTSPLRPQFFVNKSVTITLPFTIEFQISRKALATAQTASFKLYNLAEATRNALQRDAFNTTQFRAIQFRAGYESPAGDFMPLVFNGSVLSANSYRKGVDFITEIEALDGGWQMNNINLISMSSAPGTSSAQALKDLSYQLTGLSGEPIIGSYPVRNKRGEVFFGNAWQIIQLKSNFQAIIDNGQVKALNLNEIIVGEIPVISSATGLLGSPRRGNATLEFDMIFEPRLTIYQLVKLESTTQPLYNRNWKVMGIEHQGTISPRISGDALTKVTLLFTNTSFVPVAATLVQ
jgi:hypothetical protein